MRLAAMESVLCRCMGYYVVDVTDEGWTSASLESRWFETGEQLARNFVEVENGVLVDRRGTAFLQH